jgi:iron complex outermembrane receptor protein
VNDGSVPASVNGIALGITPSTNLINVNLDWRRVADSPIDVSLFVTNLTKERFTVSSPSSWTSAGVAEITLNQPRFYGVRLRYSLNN